MPTFPQGASETTLAQIKAKTDNIPAKGSAVMSGSTPTTLATDDPTAIALALILEQIIALQSKPINSRVVDDGAGRLATYLPNNNWTLAATSRGDPLALSTTQSILHTYQGPIDQRWEMRQRSIVEWDNVRGRFTFAPFNANFKKGIDQLPWLWTMFAPTATVSGSLVANAPAGTNRYVYVLLTTTSFWRYDTWSDTYEQLASPGGNALGASSMCYDADNNYVWFLTASTSTTCTFSLYNTATNVWTSRSITGLPATWGTESRLVHTATAHGGNGDYIYLVGNGATTFYRYSISGNSWSTLTVAPATILAGCGLVWDYGNNVDHIYCWRGGATSSIFRYSIAGNSWTTLTATALPGTETYNLGTSYAYSPTEKRVYIKKDATGRLRYYDTLNNLYAPYGQQPWADGTGLLGNKMVYLKSSDGMESLWMLRNTGQETFQTLVGVI